MTVKYVIKNR